METTGRSPVPATITVWSSLICPWGSLAVHRLHTVRARLGLTDQVRLDHRPFPLELINGRPTSKATLDAEITAIASHAPELGWQPWQGREDAFPSTVLLAQEAVQAAKAPEVGGLAASEQLDAALRRAFFAESRPIYLWAVIAEVARKCRAVNATALEAALRQGAGRAEVMAGWQTFEAAGVKGSPHVFLADGTDAHNPGVSLRWVDGYAGRRPVIDSDEPAVYEDLLLRAAKA